MKNRYPLWLCVAVGAILLQVLFIGDIPWINDEPLLFQEAIEGVHGAGWWRMGLTGSTGLPYGPVPWWIYRCFLFFTSDLIIIAALKAFFCAAIVLIALVGILRSLNVPWQWSLAVFLSPYLYFYNRILWDNCFLIPVSALFVYFCLRYFNEARLWNLSIVLVLAWLLIHIHLMAVALIVPLLFQILFQRGIHRRAGTLLVFSIWVLALLPYFREVVIAIRAGNNLSSGVSLRWVFLVIPLFPRFFSFFGFSNYFFPEISWVDPLSIFALIPFGLFWWGLWLMRAGRWRVVYRWVLGTLAITLLLHMVGRLERHPHYLNATWVLSFIPLIVAARESLKYRAGRALLSLYFVTQLGLLVFWVVTVHRNGGDRGIHYGATLANQLEVARELGKTPDAAIDWQVENYRFFPHARQVIRELVISKPVLYAHAEVKYRDEMNPSSGWIKLVPYVKAPKPPQER